MARHSLRPGKETRRGAKARSQQLHEVLERQQREQRLLQANAAWRRMEEERQQQQQAEEAEREDSKISKNRKTSVSFSNKEDNVRFIEAPESIIERAIFKIRDMLSAKMNERERFIILGPAGEERDKIISNLMNAEKYLISLMDSINDRKNFIEQLNQQDKIDFLEKELKETYD